MLKGKLWFVIEEWQMLIHDFGEKEEICLSPITKVPLLTKCQKVKVKHKKATKKLGRSFEEATATKHVLKLVSGPDRPIPCNSHVTIQLELFPFYLHKHLIFLCLKGVFSIYFSPFPCVIISYQQYNKEKSICVQFVKCNLYGWHQWLIYCHCSSLLDCFVQWRRMFVHYIISIR